ncbi:MAG TPA: FAD:protein FMN transferase, partial [Solirubrobacteraceae bacterium]|nr:FAD:protein FMN transferase [Solirubrobacteraceae bacterium]
GGSGARARIRTRAGSSPSAADHPRVMIDRSFTALGTTVRVIVDALDEEERAARAEALIRDYDRRLSRFRPDSELCALNADPRETVPASALLRQAVEAALIAARTSGGLVDPTLLDALERAGYIRSLAGGPFESRISRAKGPTAPARPDPAQRWREIEVTDDTIRRPVGMRLDLGGSGKGHAADLVADEVLAGARRWAIDAGGDLRVGGTDAAEQTIEVEHPFAAQPAARLSVRSGAVATSATHARAWDGGHHLLDPATKRPANTGVTSATAIATTVLEAETRAKVALLSGRAAPGAAVLILDDGKVVRR